MLAVLIIAIGGAAYFGKQALEYQQQHTVQAMAQMVDRYLEQGGRILDAVARIAEREQTKGIETAMISTREAYKYFDTIYLLDKNHRIKMLAPLDKSYLNMDMSNYSEFRNTGRRTPITISSPFISPRTGDPTVFLIRHLSLGGYVVGELSLGELQLEVTKRKHISEKGTIFILDQFGNLLAHPTATLVKQQTNLGYLEIFHRGVKGNITLAYDYKGTKVLGSTALINRVGWVVIDQSSLYVLVRPYAWTLGITFLASLVIWITLIWNLRKKIQRNVISPLEQLSRSITALSGGKINQANSLSAIPESFKELNSLASDFRQMSTILQERQVELQESEERFRSLVDRVPIGIFRTNAGRCIIAANPSLVEMLGYESSDELMDANIADFFTSSDDQDHLISSLQQYRIIRDFETTMQRKDGNIIWIRMNVLAVHADEGHVLCYEGSIEDITRSKEAESEKEKLQLQFNQAQKMESVGRLAGGVAHDFNNMLSVILGNTEMAIHKVDPSDPLHKTLQDILHAAQRSADLTRQLLGFARKQLAIPKVLDLNDIVSGMLKMLRRLIGEDIDLAWMPGLNLWSVKIDPTQVDQILANLTVNARDAIVGVGKITIETSNVVLDESYCSGRPECIPGEYVMLAVSDDGCGIDKEILANIFEPFFTTKKEGQGTGLGLATVYGIIRQNNGFINVYSEPNKGTTFKIHLPRFIVEIREDADNKEEMKIQGGTETILIVEDEEVVLELAKSMLEMLGYNVMATRKSNEAIQIFREYEGDINLLLADVVMPDMSSKELSDRICSIKPGMKCLYMSGYTQDIIARQGILEEGVHFLPKPFSTKDLAAKVREALD